MTLIKIVRILVGFLILSVFTNLNCDSAFAQNPPATASKADMNEQEIASLKVKITQLEQSLIKANTEIEKSNSAETLSLAMTIFTIATGGVLLCLTILGVFMSLGVFKRLDATLNNQNEEISKKLIEINQDVINAVDSKVEGVESKIRDNFLNEFNSMAKSMSLSQLQDLRQIFVLGTSMSNKDGNSNDGLRDFSGIIYQSIGLFSKNSEEVVTAANELRALAARQNESFRSNLLILLKHMHGRKYFDFGNLSIQQTIINLCDECGGSIFEAKGSLFNS